MANLQRRRVTAIVVVVWACLAFAAARAADAHTIGLSRGDYRILGSKVSVELVFARQELAVALPDLDIDRDGTLSQTELAGGHSALEDAFVRRLVVNNLSGPCVGSLERIDLAEGDGASMGAIYRCPASAGVAADTVTFDPKFLSALTRGHRHLASVTVGATTVHVVAYEENARFQIAAPLTPPEAGRPAAMFALGMQQTLGRFAPLVLLVGLILVGGRMRSLLTGIAAFGIACWIGLFFVALRNAEATTFVEPAIAIAIAYLGLENLFIKDAAGRWMVAIPFGLIQGISLAGALRPIAVPHADVPLVLVSFSAGVGAGQLAALAVAMPVICWLRRHQWFDHGMKAMSGALAIAGAWWLIVAVV